MVVIALVEVDVDAIQKANVEREGGYGQREGMTDGERRIVWLRERSRRPKRRQE